MTVGEWLASVGVRQLVTMPGALSPAALSPAAPERPGPPRRVPAPDEACARLLATAAAWLDGGPGAIWDGEVLTLLSRPATVSRGPAPAAPAETAPSPAALVAAFEAFRTGDAAEVRLRLDFPRDSPVLDSSAPTVADTQATARSQAAADAQATARPQAVAGVVGSLLAQDEAPLNPARAAADVSETLPANGIILAEPGAAGLWVDHTPAAARGDVSVATVGAVGGGLAVAGALLAGRRGQIGVAVVEQPPAGATATLLELASDLDVSLVVEVWGRRGGLRSAADHRERLAAALNARGVRVIEVPVDFTATKLLIDAAGTPAAVAGR